MRVCGYCGEPVSLTDVVDGKLDRWYYCEECDRYMEVDETMHEDDVLRQIALEKAHIDVEDAVGALEHASEVLPVSVAGKTNEALALLKKLHETLHEEAIGCARKARR